MVSAEVTLPNPAGLHLLPANFLAGIAAKFEARIEIANVSVDPLRDVDAKDVLSVVSLAAGAGARLRVRAEGADEAEAVAALAAAIRSGRGEQVPVERRPRVTPRQSQILQLMAAGLSQKQIARRLGLSGHTIRHHVTRLYANLGVHDSAHAVMTAVRAGLLVA